MNRKLMTAVIGCIVCLGGMFRMAADAQPLAEKKVLMVIAPANYRDEELTIPRQILEKKGATVTVASTTLEQVKGMLGLEVKPDALLKDVKASAYDAIVFVGGSGAEMLFSNLDAHRLARNGVKQGKVVGAICLAPCILANASVLRDRKATVFPRSQYVNILRLNGATYVEKQVVEDDRMVTANGPKAATRFADALVRALALPFKDDPPE